MNVNPRQKLIYISAMLVGLLIIVRLAMPYVLLRYVNTTLNQIPGYQTHINDLDMNLLQGGYTIKGIQFTKIKNRIPVPYFSADRAKLKLQWSALFKGHIVGEIILKHPQLNFVIDRRGNKQQLTISSSWQDRVKELYPFRFNHITINNGEIHLRNFTSSSPFDLYLKNVNAQASNLTNNEQNKNTSLPSAVVAHGNTMDGAIVNLNITFDPLAKQPTFDMDAEIKKMNITAANALLREFTKVSVKKGLFSLYVEAAGAKGKVTGYAKPLLENLQIRESNEQLSLPQKIYKSVIAGAAQILKNPNTQAVATKITISGNINDPTMSVWSLIINLLRNAFIQALLPQIDNTVHYNNIRINQ